MRYVNLGCGSRFHPAWTNFDIVTTGPGVIAHDLSQGIPLPSASCDVVYHSHVLEHLRRPDAERLIGECFRVLRPGGVLRVAIPDLERICRTYLYKLEAALAGDTAAAADYDWILLELYDQTVREQSGGGMKHYLARSDIPNEAFVYERIGEEGRLLVRELRRAIPSAASGRAKRGLRHVVRSALAGARNRAATILLGRSAIRERQVGSFRLAGEVHQWMYDRFSLGRLLTLAGFTQPMVQAPTSSLIADWRSFHLDTLPDGSVNKPDSLYMEAVRPSQDGALIDASVR